MDKVRISIVSRQEAADGHVERLRQEMEGRYFFKGGRHYLRYEDGQLDGQSGTTTTIKLSAEEMLVLRRGAAAVAQRFVPDRETKAAYQTPCGVMELAMRTHAVQAEFGGAGGHARVQYHLSVNGSPVGEYEIEIQVEAY